MANTKVYILSTGEYSDSHIVGIFSTRENAELVSKTDERFYIEECELDGLVDIAKQGFNVYHIIMNKNGDVSYKGVEGLDYALDYEKPSLLINTQGNLNCTVLAKSYEHAIKITNEKRAYLIANNMWLGKLGRLYL